MNQLYVEANKSYKQGFILTEQELRRFNELIREQIKKINPQANIAFNFQVKFQSGIVAETQDLEYILDLENEASKKLITLIASGKDEKSNLISFDFYNIDSDSVDSKYSIKYNIRSSDRDWVFVTSSLIEERISKIKRFSFASSSPIISKSAAMLLPLLIVFAISLTMITTLTKNADYVKDIKANYEKGLIKNTNDLILQLEQKRYEQTALLNHPGDLFYYPGLVIGGILILLIVIGIYIQKLYPLYNFCWGDYLEVFKKKETTRKTFNTVVIIGLIVSIIGSLIANRFKF